MKKVTESMLADIIWIESILMAKPREFDKRITMDMINRSKEFITGVFYERERISKELRKAFICDLSEFEQK